MLEEHIQTQKLSAIDFFCGGGGMTHGLKMAGINVLAGIDSDGKCEETYEYNNSPARFIKADIKSLKPQDLEVGIEVGKDENKVIIKVEKDDDNMIFVGCSPCQYWSLINTDKTKAEESKNLLTDFQDFIDYFNPGYVLVENVPGIVTAENSPLNDFIDFLSKKGYCSIAKDILKVCEYGVPQTRKRFVLIASRVNKVSLPESIKDSSLTVRRFIGTEKFSEVEAGYKDETEFCHTTAGLSETNLERLAFTAKNGGTREGWKNTNLQLKVYKDNENTKDFGFTDVYGRMHWDKPAPTITTRFYSLSNGRFGHPEQDRAISLREGATLQTFPLTYVFKAKTITDIARMIGNAVPPELARRIGLTLLSLNNDNLENNSCHKVNNHNLQESLF
jgi:DNA (cytosine-5)-methyltransferase 1